MSAYFTKRKYVFLIVFTVLCAGMVTGAFSTLNTVAETETMINQMSHREIIISSFTENLKFLGWVVLWGANLFGFPVIIYLLYAKGITISAAVCGIAMTGKSSAIVILSALPYLACTIASIMILSQGSLYCSFRLFKSMWGKRNGNFMSQDVMVMIGEFIPAIALALLGGVCETIFKVNIV